jgi:hypothetical protein
MEAQGNCALPAEPTCVASVAGHEARVGYVLLLKKA